MTRHTSKEYVCIDRMNHKDVWSDVHLGTTRFTGHVMVYVRWYTKK